jgi:hypothetical protein
MEPVSVKLASLTAPSHDLAVSVYVPCADGEQGVAAGVGRAYHFAAGAGPECNEQEHAVHPSGIGPRPSSRPARIRDN